MKSFHILATGKYIPEKVLTNDDLSKIVQTSDDWIVSRTGIRRRHILEGKTNGQMAAAAAKVALDNSGIDPNDLCCLIVATFSIDTFSPAVACEVHGILDLPEHVLAFDVNDACPGFLMALHVARGLVAQYPGKKALVVASEFCSDFIDWTDRSTCVLFGDGAAAVVLSLEGDSPIYFTGGTKMNLDAITIHSNPRAGEDFHKIRMRGKEVFRFAVWAMQRLIEDLLDQSGLSKDDIDHFVCHQANFRIIKHVYEKMDLDPSKFFLNMDEYGNTSAASTAIALAELNESGKLKRGDKVLMAAFGAGLVWEGILFEW